MCAGNSWGAELITCNGDTQNCCVCGELHELSFTGTSRLHHFTIKKIVTVLNTSLKQQMYKHKLGHALLCLNWMPLTDTLKTEYPKNISVKKLFKSKNKVHNLVTLLVKLYIFSARIIDHHFSLPSKIYF
jgi:hypothetical protein